MRVGALRKQFGGLFLAKSVRRVLKSLGFRSPSREKMQSIFGQDLLPLPHEKALKHRGFKAFSFICLRPAHGLKLRILTLKLSVNCASVAACFQQFRLLHYQYSINLHRDSSLHTNIFIDKIKKYSILK